MWKKTSSIVTSTVAYAETLAAIHLASALIVQQRIDEEFVFACYDKSLNESAGKEGLITLP